MNPAVRDTIQSEDIRPDDQITGYPADHEKKVTHGLQINKFSGQKTDYWYTERVPWP